MDCNENIYTSSHVIGELQAGISLLEKGARKLALQARLIETPPRHRSE